MSRVLSATWTWTLLLTLGFGSLGPSTVLAETFKIGKHGATIELEPPWTRGVFSKDLGPNQFVWKKRFLFQQRQLHLVVLELEELVESREDAERSLGDVTMPAGVDPDVTLGPVVASSSAGRWTARRDAEIDFGGLKMATRFIVVSQGGLTYVLIVMASRSQAGAIDEHAGSLARRLEFPGPGSEWHELTTPVSKTVALGDDTEVSFSYRPCVFEPAEAEEGWTVDLASRDDGSSILVGERSGYRDADAALDSTLQALRGSSSDVKIGPRTDFRAGETPGRRAIFVVDGHTVTAVALPGGEGQLIVVRHVGPGDPEIPRADRDLLFESLRVRRAEPVDAFPVESPKVSIVPLDPAVAELLRGSRLLGDSGLSYARQALRFGDVLLVTDGREVRRLKLGSEGVETLYRDAESYSPWTLVGSGDGFFLAGAGDELLWVTDGETEPSGIRADSVAPLGTGTLILSHSTTPTELVGLGRLSWVGPQLVATQQLNGEERKLAELDGPLLRCSADAEGTAVLAAVDARPPSEGGAIRLEVLPLEGGDAETQGGWRDVSHITAAEGGWLVTGRRAGDSPGVYLVARGKEPRLLLGGSDFVGVSLREGHVTFLSKARLPERGAATSLLVYEAPLELVEAQGRLTLPFSVSVLNRLGAEALRSFRDRWPPRDAETVREIAAKARELSEKEVGRPIPTEAVALDRVISEVYPVATDLRPEAELLLGTLLAASWLDQGAEWISGESGEEPAYWLPRLVPERSNPLVITRSPYAVMASTLHDPEGYWEPAQAIPRDARGRRILIGVDRDALTRAVQAAPTPDLAFLARETDPAAVLALLRSAPRNEHLRELVYLHLAQASRYELLARVAGQILDGANAAALDRRASLGARVEVARIEGASQELLDDLFAAIRQDPNEASLYVYLAKAYEILGSEARKVKACLRKALELQSWGSVAEFANERLDAIQAE